MPRNLETWIIAKARTEAELATAESARDLALHTAINKELADATRLMKGYVEASKPAEPRKVIVNRLEGTYAYTSAGPGQDKTADIAQMQAYIDKLHEKDAAINYDAELRNATRRQDKNAAANANRKEDKPYVDKIAELKTAMDAANSRLKSAGLDDATKGIAKAEGEALKAIEEVNKHLRAQHELESKPGSPQAAVIDNHVSKTVQKDDEAGFRDKVQEVNAKLGDQLKTQQMINAAIGQGWEAQAKVNVEIALMHDFGFVKYSDSGHAAEVEAARVTALAVERAKNTAEVNKANLATRDGIALDTSLARVQSLGAEAVRLATLQQKIAIAERNGATRETIDLIK
jgi:hypothetical protein